MCFTGPPAHDDASAHEPTNGAPNGPTTAAVPPAPTAANESAANEPASDGAAANEPAAADGTATYGTTAIAPTGNFHLLKEFYLRMEVYC